MTLKEKLADWMEWDGASFELGALLGLWESSEKSWLENKGGRLER